VSRRADVSVSRFTFARRAEERPHEFTTVYVQRFPSGEREQVQVSVSYTGKVRVFWNDEEVRRASADDLTTEDRRP